MSDTTWERRTGMLGEIIYSVTLAPGLDLTVSSGTKPHPTNGHRRVADETAWRWSASWRNGRSNAFPSDTGAKIVALQYARAQLGKATAALATIKDFET